MFVQFATPKPVIPVRARACAFAAHDALVGERKGILKGASAVGRRLQARSALGALSVLLGARGSGCGLRL